MSAPLLAVDVVSVFPEYVAGPASLSLLGKAQRAGLLAVRCHDLRAWTDDAHRTVDDTPYGGGPGMVMRVEPWARALADLGVPERGAAGPGAPRVVVPSPSGAPFTQARAADLAGAGRLIVLCGRYEGIDQRVLDAYATDVVSLGDYVLAGGEVAALVVLEAVSRLVPGVVGNAESVTDDSFAAGLLEGPVYTRPPDWRGRAVPPVLLSGDHAAVARWRRDEALRRTAARRPDLLAALEAQGGLSDRDRQALEPPVAD